MRGLIYNECYKIFRLRKFHLFIGAIIVIQAIYVLQYLLSPNKHLATAMNGQSFPLAIIDNQTMIMVLFIAVMAADLIADEMRSGTFKLTLLRPTSRSQLIGAKAVALSLAVAAIAIFSVAAAYLIGTCAFGWGPHVLFRGAVISGGVMITLQSALASILPSIGFGMLVMFIAFLSRSVGITISTSIVLYIFSSYLELYGSFKHYSILYLMSALPAELVTGIRPPSLLTAVGIILAYAVIFFAASVIRLRRLDIVN